MTAMALDNPETTLADLQHLVGRLVAADKAEWCLDQLEQTILGLHQITQRLAAVQAEAIASFDARGGAKLLGARTTGNWLARHTHLLPNQTGSLVHTARDLRHRMPHTAQALADGAITVDHVKVIRAALREITAEAFAAYEPDMADFARRHNVRDLRGFVDLIIQNYQKDTHDTDTENARAKRRAHLSTGLDGWWHLNGFLDPATGAALAAALDIYAHPAGPDDTRTAANRTVDALAEIATRALDTTDRPSGLGHITLTLTPEQLTSGLGVRWPSGSLASRTDLRTASCSARVTYVVGIPVDGVHWQPLAVGFAERYATKAQRAALAARDGNTCVYPDCTVPAHRCIAHHIRHWDQGGPTDLENLVLVCVYHHRRIHHGTLAISKTPDGPYTAKNTTTRAPP